MQNPRTYWDELVAAALIGVTRRPTLPTPTIDSLVISRNETDPATTLLDQAAVAALYLRAGKIAPRSEASGFAIAPPDDVPTCGPQAAHHLALILDDPDRTDLPEWLQLLAAAGLRLPESRLTDLLDLARHNSRFRPLVAQVLGARGRWLAALNPNWRIIAAPDNPLERWHEGEHTERLAALQQIRAGDPAQARLLIAEIWASERADERASFVETLAVGLSMDDEPWLEQTLDDRSREVRRHTAQLLSQLPESRFAQRMAERAGEYLRLIGDLRLNVRLPTACDAAMQRDGIEAKPPRSNLGERAWWLHQIIAHTPPSYWSGQWGMTPTRIIAATPDEWRGLLLEAWQQASVTYRDHDWVAALADTALSGDENVRLERLIELLPADRRDDLLTWMLSAQYRPSGNELAILQAVPKPWSDRLAKAALQAMTRRLRAGDSDQRADWPLRIASECVTAISPELAEYAAAVLPSNRFGNTFWNNMISGFVERLRFRRDMREAIVGRR